MLNIDFEELAKDAKLYGVVNYGNVWDYLTKRRMRSPLSLEPYGYKVYSQNDEDGIIHEIFRRIGTTNKKFIEFGVENGLESNTHLLLFYGWSGLWIEGSSIFCEQINTKFRPVIKKNRLEVLNRFITKDNINKIFSESELFKKDDEIDLLSIDIDGNDYYVWDAINYINPRVVVVEYNGKFPPDLSWTQAYNPTHEWDYSDWHGASLKALENLSKTKGYRLVGTNLQGANAFFVRQDLVEDKFLIGGAEELYNPLRTNLSFVSAHKPRYCLAEQEENLGCLNYLDFELKNGFYPLGDSEWVWMKNKEAEVGVRIPANACSLEIPVEYPNILYQAENPKYNVRIVLIDEDSIIEKAIKFSREQDQRSFQLDIPKPSSKERIILIKIFVSDLCKKVDSLDTRLFGIRLNLYKLKFV